MCCSVADTPSGSRVRRVNHGDPGESDPTAREDGPPRPRRRVNGGSRSQQRGPVQLLHVDDEATVRKVTARYLEEADPGIDVETAATAEEALKLLEESTFDCVISDYEMPGRDGLDFLETVRDEDGDIPFILFTGKGSEEVASDAISKGVTDYLQKGPAVDQYEVLLNRVRNAVDRYHLRARFETFLDSAPDAVLVADDRGVIKQANPRAEELFGYAGDELLGMTVEELMPERYREEHVSHREDYAGDPETRPMGADLDLYGLHADGSEFPVDIAISPVQVGGQVETMVAIRDVTDQKEREETLEEQAHRLEEQKQRYRDLYEDVPVGLFEVTPDRSYFDVNETLLDMLGYEDIEELRSVGIANLYKDPADREAVFERLESEGQVSSHEVELVRSDGEAIWAEIHGRVVDHHDGEPVIRGAFLDVTGRHLRQERLREREEALAEANERLRAAIEASPEAIIIVDGDGIVQTWNPAAEEIFGWSEDEVVGEPKPNVPPDRWDEFEELVGRVLEGDPATGVETQRRTRDGDRVDVRISTAPIHDADDAIVGAMEILTDITDQKERERHLEQAETVFQHSEDALFLLELEADDTYRFTRVNDAYVEQTGLARDEVEGETLVEAFDETIRDQMDDLIQRSLERDEVVTHEGTFQYPDLPPHWRVSVAPVVDEDTTRIVGIARNVTEERRRERRYEAIFNQTYQFTGLMAPDGTLLEANDTALEFGGIDREDVVGEKIWDTYWFQPHEAGRVAGEAVDQAADGDFFRTEIEVQGADDSAVIDFSVRPVTDARGEVTLLIPEGRDITELKERERRLQAANERLEEFAGIVAHDLRNPLGAATEMVRIERAERDSEELEVAARALHQMEAIVEDTLTLAREGESIGETEPVDLGGVARRTWEATQVAGSDLRVEGGPTLRADPDRLERLLGNLFRNADEHAGEGPTVSVGPLDGDGFYVEDDGPGIPPDERAEVFEPGYSTAEEGTGFGLPIVRRIAEAHGWTVDVAEGRDGGARFAFRGVAVVRRGDS